MFGKFQSQLCSKKILVLATILLFCGIVVVLTNTTAPVPNVVNVRPGTDEYLRAYGLTDTQLSTATATENREAFPLTTGEIIITDPIGDVLDRTGKSLSGGVAWADLTSATWTKNLGAQTWDVRVSTAQTIPTATNTKGQLFVYVDIDGQQDNNAPGTGVRAGSDAEFVIQFNAEHGWYTDYRWYNQKADFWAQNKETLSAFSVIDNTFTLNIPFTEFPAELTPVWRVVFATTIGSETQVDAAGIAGFPPPTGETYPTIPLPTSTD